MRPELIATITEYGDKLFNLVNIPWYRNLSLGNFIVLSLTLIGVFWYACEARKTRKIMQKSLELETTPYIAIDGIEFKKDEADKKSLKFRVVIRNVGRVSSKFFIDSFSYNQVGKNNGQKNKGVLFPEQTQTLDRVFVELAEDDHISSLEVTVTYWAINNPSRKFYLLRRYKIEGERAFISEDDADEIK